MRFHWTISRYLVGAVLPYFIFAWLLLSVILFVQQASRFADIFFSVNIPANLIWQLTLALVPSVISFTCPMAVLVGVIIGLSRMQGDSELIAIRAAGVGNAQITLPIFVLGIFLSALAFSINIYGVPLAAAIVRKVAVQTAIYKLESPIEPGVFNTELAGYTVYVKDGDIEAGTWKNIFIHAEDPGGTVRLITSRSGRIDTTGQMSELVLENAVVSTFTPSGEGEKYASEVIGEFRFAIKTRRGELIEKLSSSEGAPEELGLIQLSDYARSREGAERTEAQILWQRRLVLSLTPIVFCLLGASMMLRFTGKGRGFGISVALIALVAFYLMAFLGEQLARTGRISVLAGSLIPIVVSFAAVTWFYLGGRIGIFRGLFGSMREKIPAWRPRFRRTSRRRNFFVDLTTGLRDFDLLSGLLKYYLLTLAFLGSVFVIFTAFELWKFAGTMDGGVYLLVRYLIYLTPFMYLQLAPSAAMVATLATYVIKSRQNEIVTWISAGQSTYRLLLPCFALMMVLGAVNWQVQERIAPAANQAQDDLRSRLRSRGDTARKAGKYWIATDERIYSFELPTAGAGKSGYSDKAASDNVPPSQADPAISNGSKNVVAPDRTNNPSASDNEPPHRSDCAPNCVITNLTLYEIADNGKLQALYRSDLAEWTGSGLTLGERATKKLLGEGKISVQSAAGIVVAETANPILEIKTKPSHLTIGETRAQIENSASDLEKRNFAVALEKKYSTLILPFVISLFTAPFALSLSRKGKVVTVGYAVALWLFFTALTSTFEQLGASGALAPELAVWSPLILFAMLGVFLLSRVRT